MTDLESIQSFNDRWNIWIPGDHQETIEACLDHFIKVCGQAIEDHGAFYVALSGGSTPKAIFELLCHKPHVSKVDWEKVWLFWSDERNVKPEDPHSNYKMAMDAGFSEVSIPQNQIFRMEAEKDIEKKAEEYEQTIRKTLKERPFDMIMLGMGEDGHTASLFPNTEGLKASGRLVIANYIPPKDAWRMTMTFDCINQAENIVIYVLGVQKKEIVGQVFHSNEHFPIKNVGTPEKKVLFIFDEAAAALL